MSQASGKAAAARSRPVLNRLGTFLKEFGLSSTSLLGLGYAMEHPGMTAGEVQSASDAYWNHLWHSKMLKGTTLLLAGWMVLWVGLCASRVVPGEEVVTYRINPTCTHVIDGDTVCSQSDVLTKDTAVGGWGMTIGLGIPLVFFCVLWFYQMAIIVFVLWFTPNYAGSKKVMDAMQILHSGLFLASFLMFLPRWSGTTSIPWWSVALPTVIALFGYGLQVLIGPHHHQKLSSSPYDDSTNGKQMSA